MVPGTVFAPARDGHVAHPAVAAPGAGQQAVVAAIGEELHCGSVVAGVAEDAQPGFARGCHRAHAGNLGLVRMEHPGVRYALLQEQQGRLELGVGDEALLHRLVVQQVGQHGRGGTAGGVP